MSRSSAVGTLIAPLKAKALTSPAAVPSSASASGHRDAFSQQLIAEPKV